MAVYWNCMNRTILYGSAVWWPRVELKKTTQDELDKG